MNFITKNLKQAGIFNTVLIVIATILQIYQLCIMDYKSASGILYFYDIITIIALVSGLFYAFYGYKKEASKYYKVFMALTFITFLCSAISNLPYSYLMILTCISFVRLIPIALLAFKKDFGKKNSIICAYTTFALTLAIVLIGVFVFVTPLKYLITLILNNVLLSVIVIIFVEAKYADKEARGTK